MGLTERFRFQATLVSISPLKTQTQSERKVHYGDRRAAMPKLALGCKTP